MLKFVPDYLKTRKMCKRTVQKLPDLLRHVPDQCKFQKMYDKVENGETLQSVLDCYKNQVMYNKAVDNYPHALEFVPECYKTQKCVRKLLILILLQLNIFWNAIRLKKCVIKQFIDVFYLSLFLINIKRKKYVTWLFLYIFFNSILQ